MIPARGGSKGIPKKNIRLLGGYPLIAYSIIAAVMSKEIERVIVSTDSEEIAGIARYYGAEVPFLRPAQYASDESPDSEWVLHLINWLDENEGRAPEFLVHLRPTTPLREPAVIDSAIAEIRNRPEATSLRSGHPAPESPFKWCLRDGEGYFTGILPEYSNEYTNKPRQLFPEVYIPDGHVDILKTSFIREYRILHGEKTIGFISPVCHEIDTFEDFEFLQFELARKGSPLYNYLKINFPLGE